MRTACGNEWYNLLARAAALGDRTPPHNSREGAIVTSLWSAVTHTPRGSQSHHAHPTRRSYNTTPAHHHAPQHM